MIWTALSPALRGWRCEADNVHRFFSDIPRTLVAVSVNCVISRAGASLCSRSYRSWGDPRLLVPYAAGSGKPSGGRMLGCWRGRCRQCVFPESQVHRHLPWPKPCISIPDQPKTPLRSDGPKTALGGAVRMPPSPLTSLSRSACSKGTPMSPATKLPTDTRPYLHFTLAIFHGGYWPLSWDFR